MGTIVQAAQACHEANRIYCESIGDFSQVAWEDAEPWQRESAIAGVRAVHLDPHRPPAASHEGWLAHKKAEGWKYGEFKDPEKKTHPCMVPWEVLPTEQQMKDIIFLTVAKLALGK